MTRLSNKREMFFYKWEIFLWKIIYNDDKAGSTTAIDSLYTRAELLVVHVLLSLTHNSPLEWPSSTPSLGAHKYATVLPRSVRERYACESPRVKLTLGTKSHLRTRHRRTRWRIVRTYFYRLRYDIRNWYYSQYLLQVNKIILYRAVQSWHSRERSWFVFLRKCIKNVE